jgi:hypothetical protein
MRLPIGTLIYPYPTLLKTLTHCVYYIELLAPILIILPFVSSKIRLTGLFLSFCLFVGIGSTIYVGLFYIIGIVSLVGFLPAACMNWFEIHFYKNKTLHTKLHISEKTNSTVDRALSTIKTYFIILIFSFCLLMNLGSIPQYPYAVHPNMIQGTKALRLEQNWGMFSPSILKDDGWFIYSGLTSSHQYIDIKNNANLVNFEKPSNIVEQFESDRWRKFQENYTFDNNNFMRNYYCKYLIKRWNKNHPENHILDLTIFFMKETSLPNYKTMPIKKTAVCNCNDK